MTHLAGTHERLIAPHKRRVFAALNLREGDRLVDVGAGAGANVPFVPRGVRYTAVEPNTYMHPHLLRRAAEVGIEAELINADGAAMPLAEGSVDAVVATLLLCSVPSPALVLRDIRRVLRPGGRFGFVEHVAAPAGTWQRWVQRAARPLWRALGDGCEPDRQTGRALHAAGFSRLELEEILLPLPVIGPHNVGWAER